MVGDPTSRKFGYRNDICLLLLHTQNPIRRWGRKISIADRVHQWISCMLRQLVFGFIDFYIKAGCDPISSKNSLYVTISPLPFCRDYDFNLDRTANLEGYVLRPY